MCTIRSRILNRELNFSRPGGGYIFVDLNDEPGCLGEQICSGGKLMGSTLHYGGDSDEVFFRICRKWYRAYIKNLREMGDL